VKSVLEPSTSTESNREHKNEVDMSIKTELEKDWEQYDGKSPRWDAVVNLMDNDTREQVHAELAPCSEQDFFDRYLEFDPDFGNIREW
jgi:hypothetical protein